MESTSDKLNYVPPYFKLGLKKLLTENFEFYKKELEKFPIIIHDEDYQVSIKTTQELTDIVETLNDFKI